MNNKKIVTAAAFTSLALCILTVVLAVVAFLILPNLPEQDFGGLAEALAGSLAMALALVVMLVIVLIVAAVSLVFYIIATVLLMRARAGYPAGMSTAIALFVMTIGTIAALTVGIMLCGISHSAVLIAVSAVYLVAVTAEAAVRVSCAVRLLLAARMQKAAEEKAAEAEAQAAETEPANSDGI